jgi:uncharacterized membrane protein (TIGR02234 family)
MTVATKTRGLAAALVAVAIGGALILVASGRVWSTATVHVPGAPTSTVSVTGRTVEPSLPALGIALLALAVAVIAASGVMRRLVGAVVALLGAIAVGTAIAGRGAVSSALTAHEIGDANIPVHGTANGWWVLAAIGGAIALLVGIVVTARSNRWAAMGRKYEAPQPKIAATADPSDSAWEALDRGEDPTE